MKTVYVLSGVVLVAMLLSTSVAAVWQWDSYSGVTRWSVKITENEEGCGGDVETSTRTVDINHNFKIVDLGDLGHGKVRGAMTGNIAHFDGRTIPDGSGSSKLLPVDVLFSADCLTFDGRYDWDYKDNNMGCSGWTRIEGTNIAKRCPENVRSTLIVDIRRDSDVANREKLYAERLKEKPTDFWANWDMAEIKRKQGDTTAYFKYFDNALSNENIKPDTAEKMKAQQLELLHLPKRPTPGTSPILRLEGDELKGWTGGKVYNVDYQKPATFDFEEFKRRMWCKLASSCKGIVDEVIGVPTE